MYAILALALRSLIDWLAYRLAKIDAQHEQEAADDKAAAAEELRAQQIAAVTAAANASATVPATPVPESAALPASVQDPPIR